jgi:asparagine N-glycosylation enzyme membrane subunit Stt3
MGDEISVSPEAAQAELARIEEDFDRELDADSRDVLLRALRAGLLEWDAAENQFRYRLRRPVVLDNGEQITTMSLSEPSVLQVKKATAIKDELEQTVKLISYMADVPVGYIDRIRMRDMTVLGVLVGFFA